MKKILMLVMMLVMSICSSVYAGWIDMPTVRGAGPHITAAQCLDKFGGRSAIIQTVDNMGTLDVYFEPGCCFYVMKNLGTGKADWSKNSRIFIQNPDVPLDNTNVRVGDSVSIIQQKLGDPGDYRPLKKELGYMFEYYHPVYQRKERATLIFYLDNNDVCEGISIGK